MTNFNCGTTIGGRTGPGKLKNSCYGTFNVFTFHNSDLL